MKSAALVIGQGSIGQRHARILSDMDCAVTVVSRRSNDAYPSASSLIDALARFAPNYVIVANETSVHAETLSTLAEQGYSGKILVEKPLFSAPQPLPLHRFSKVAVGYNLRFHPLVQELYQRLNHAPLLGLQLYCGQYLPDWRPQTDHRTSYSAHRALGGGVLRDLSHELDLLLWLGGDWQRLAALGGRISDLTVDSDDGWATLLQTQNCPMATVQINYLDRPGRRTITAHTATDTFHLDFLQGTLWQNGTHYQIATDRDASYRALHQAMLDDSPQPDLCSLDQGQAVMILIAAVEKAAATGQWIDAKETP